MNYVLYHFLVANEVGIGKAKQIEAYRKGDPAFDVGTEHMVSWFHNSAELYLAKIIKYGKNKAELMPLSDTLLFQLNAKLKIDQEKAIEVPRSEKKKKRKRLQQVQKSESDSDESDHEITEKAALKLKKKMEESTAKDILNQINKTSSFKKLEEDPAMLLRQENRQLMSENIALREENSHLKVVIAAIQGLPKLLERMESLTVDSLSVCRSLPIAIPSSLGSSCSSQLQFQSSSSHSSSPISSLPRTPTPTPTPDSPRAVTPQDPKSSSHPHISSTLVSRCSRLNANKFTNDLLHGIFNAEYMATHSVTGGKSSKNADDDVKPGLDPAMLRGIIDAVQKAFPGRTDAEVKSYIRVKLHNAATAFENKKNNAAKTVKSTPVNPVATDSV